MKKRLQWLAEQQRSQRSRKGGPQVNKTTTTDIKDTIGYQSVLKLIIKPRQNLTICSFFAKFHRPKS